MWPCRRRRRGSSIRVRRDDRAARSAQAGEPLFRIARARRDGDSSARPPVDSMARLTPDLSATVEIVGVGELAGKVRLISTSVNPATQLGAGPDLHRCRFARSASACSARRAIQLSRRCGPALPLSAVLYGAGGQIRPGRAQRPRRDAPGRSSASCKAGEAEIVQAWPRARSPSPAPAPSSATATGCFPCRSPPASRRRKRLNNFNQLSDRRPAAGAIAVSVLAVTSRPGRLRYSAGQKGQLRPWS